MENKWHRQILSRMIFKNFFCIEFYSRVGEKGSSNQFNSNGIKPDLNISRYFKLLLQFLFHSKMSERQEYSCHFPIGILGQVWCLIVSTPDLSPLSYH